MKKIWIGISIVVLLLVSCSTAPAASAMPAADQGVSRSLPLDSGRAQEKNQDQAPQTLGAVEVSGLTEAEIDSVLFMLEEEKLARDVYLGLADTWGMTIFSNIAASEMNHMEAVYSVVESAGWEDPLQGLDRGEFNNQDLQSLYDELIERGGSSLAEALLVGAAIEEIDILDLQAYLAKTEDSGLIGIYQHLLEGSYNHLQSFVRVYTNQTGEAYQPQFLSQEAFQEILASASSPAGRQGTDGAGQSLRGRGQNSQGL